MQCAECKNLDIYTSTNRRWAGIGYAVCQLKITPKDCGAPTLQQWPIWMKHECPMKHPLKGEERQAQFERIKKYRAFIEKPRKNSR
jgi:hypothetical protein